MSLIEKIEATPVTTFEQNAFTGQCTISIRWYGKMFYGQAWCHAQDMDFYSPRFGRNLAALRAKEAILKYEKQKLEEEVKWKRIIYKEVTQSPYYAGIEVRRNLNRAERRLETAAAALKAQRKVIKDYIIAQEKMVQSVRHFRNKDENN